MFYLSESIVRNWDCGAAWHGHGDYLVVILTLLCKSVSRVSILESSQLMP